MRCPKCSYISFDLIETCVKCGKKVSNAAVELHGTVAGVAPPAFLRLAGEEMAQEVPEETSEVEAEAPLDLGEEGEEVEMDFSFEEEPSVAAAEAELDLGEAEEGEVEIDLGEEAAALEEEPQLDFASEEEAIGISDLAPSEEQEELLGQVPLEEGEEEFEVAAEEAEAAAGGGQGLEDLKVEGIDLESTPGVPESGKVMPSVKTGTALDDFDIDLGDLLTGKD